MNKSTNPLLEAVKTVYQNDPMLSLITDLKLIIEQDYSNSKQYQPSLKLSETVIKLLIKENGTNINLESCLEVIEVLIPYLSSNRKLRGIREFKLLVDNILTTSYKETAYPIIDVFKESNNKTIQPDPISRFDRGQRLLHTITNTESALDYELLRKLNILIFKPYTDKYNFGKLALILG